MVIVILFIYTVPYLNHILRNQGFKESEFLNLDHKYLEWENFFEKQCSTKNAKKNVSNNMLLKHLC